VRSPEGTVELLSNGVHVWSSDTDPDLLDELGTDAVLDEDIGDVLDYLVEAGHLTEDDADECTVDSPEDDDDPEGDDDGDDGDDEDDGELDAEEPA
jgi:hypothetical protein